uniref:Reverse transcriptase domain-containing protein n=1 Tax=Tanacetum cinerariifolium TaxID=118510 RepID=A0A6L2K983_TANCI|nr:reverse transcriptase domain-containing protein [Tanacetum cinerariifolium]
MQEDGSNVSSWGASKNGRSSGNNSLRDGYALSQTVPKTVDEIMVGLDVLCCLRKHSPTQNYPKEKCQGIQRGWWVQLAEENNGSIEVDTRRREGARGKDRGKDTVINMIQSWPDEKKRKSMEWEESRMREALQKTASAKEIESSEISLTEETLVNLAFLEQLVTIGGNLSKGCKVQLRSLLKKNMDVFAWEPSDMIEVPRWIIGHLSTLSHDRAILLENKDFSS